VDCLYPSDCLRFSILGLLRRLQSQLIRRSFSQLILFFGGTPSPHLSKYWTPFFFCQDFPFLPYVLRLACKNLFFVEFFFSALVKTKEFCGTTHWVLQIRVFSLFFFLRQLSVYSCRWTAFDDFYFCAPCTRFSLPFISTHFLTIFPFFSRSPCTLD